MDAGGDTAAALLEGGRSAVRQVNQLQADIDRESKTLGQQTSRTLYQAGVDSAAGLVRGLGAQNAQLSAAAKQLADQLVAEVKKRLGIRSPSTVFAGIGTNIGEGMVHGIAGMRPAVADEMRALADTQALSELTGVTGVGFTAAAAMPGYAPAGAAPGIDYDRLAAAIARAVPPSGGGPLFHADRVEVIDGTPQDIAQELDYRARTRGR